MNAFIQAPLRLTSRSQVAHRKRRSQERWVCQQSAEDMARPRFKRSDENKPATSFFEERAVPNTPNERALQQVRDTMTRLGADAPTPEPRPFDPIDVSRVNPFSALVGSVAAGGISYATWLCLGGLVAFFVSHPLDDQIYVIQRLGAVARTALVCLFALASGISGVTGIGLAGLFVRTSYGRIQGEFKQ